MSRIESTLTELGLTLPNLPPPRGNYLPYRIEGTFLYLPGAIASRDGKIQFAGQVGDNLTLEQGYEAAKLCALNLLAFAKLALGDLDRIDHIAPKLLTVRAIFWSVSSARPADMSAQRWVLRGYP